MRVRGTGIEKLGALTDDNSDIRNGTASGEVDIMLCRPAEVISANLLPTPIFTKTGLCADEVIVRNHAAGQGFIQPHLGFGGIFRGIAPGYGASGIGGGDVGGKFPVEHGIADTALEAASPDRGVAVTSPLVVGLEPSSDLAEPIEIRTATHIATQVCEE